MALADLVIAVALWIQIAAFQNTLNDARGKPLEAPTAALLATGCVLPVPARRAGRSRPGGVCLLALLWASAPLQQLLDVPIASGAAIA